MADACNLTTDCEVHASSGLRLMKRDYAAVSLTCRHAVELPAACCPVSKNPREGSTLTLRYVPSFYVLEVYSLRSLLRQFVGGYPGSECGTYPPERNMEGMVQLLAQMAADALCVPIRYRAVLILGTGTNNHCGVANPRPECL